MFPHCVAALPRSLKEDCFCSQCGVQVAEASSQSDSQFLQTRGIPTASSMVTGIADMTDGAEDDNRILLWEALQTHRARVDSLWLARQSGVVCCVCAGEQCGTCAANRRPESCALVPAEPR